MSPARASVSPEERAVAAAAASGIPYRVVRYEPAGNVGEAARRREIAIDRLLKTMVVRTGGDGYVLVLVPGDRAIDWKALRTHLGVRRLTLADEQQAKEATGYERGTITPFGAGGWPVIADESVPGGGEVSVGGGGQGVAIHLDGDDLVASVGASVGPVTKVAGSGSPVPTR